MFWGFDVTNVSDRKVCEGLESKKQSVFIPRHLEPVKSYDTVPSPSYPFFDKQSR